MRLLRTRGQAAVEFALGSLVFVTVLLFGIHFAEVGYLSAKVHEAAAAAMWDATAYRSYSFGVNGVNGSFYNASINAVPSYALANGAAARYADWDGRTSTAGAAPKLVLTEAQPMTVQCVYDPGNTYPLTPLAPVFGESGGIRCKAQGDIGFGLLRMPNKFLEGATGFFKAPHNSRVGTPTTLCSSGRAGGGACAGTLSVLLGDDALTDGNQSSECELQGGSGGATTCSNPRFYEATHANWNQAMGYTGMPENWADPIVSGVPGGQVTGFYLSFRGGGPGGLTAGNNFKEPNEASEGGGLWDASPMDAPMPLVSGAPPYRKAYNDRKLCSAGATAVATGGKGYCYLGKFPCGDY